MDQEEVIRDTTTSLGGPVPYPNTEKTVNRFNVVCFVVVLFLGCGNVASPRNATPERPYVVTTELENCMKFEGFAPAHMDLYIITRPFRPGEVAETHTAMSWSKKLKYMYIEKCEATK